MFSVRHTLSSFNSFFNPFYVGRSVDPYRRGPADHNLNANAVLQCPQLLQRLTLLEGASPQGGVTEEESPPVGIDADVLEKPSTGMGDR